VDKMDAKPKLTGYALEILRRMEPMRWYFPDDLKLRRGLRPETLCVLLDAGFLELKRLNWPSEKHPDAYYDMIRKVRTPDQQPCNEQDLELLKTLVKKYGKETVLSVVTGEGWKTATIAVSTVPILASGEMAGHNFQEMMKILGIKLPE
jgi:hypothetical protein